LLSGSLLPQQAREHLLADEALQTLAHSKLQEVLVAAYSAVAEATVLKVLLS
jgi:hypothetical protein